MTNIDHDDIAWIEKKHREIDLAIHEILDLLGAAAFDGEIDEDIANRAETYWYNIIDEAINDDSPGTLKYTIKELKAALI